MAGDKKLARTHPHDEESMTDAGPRGCDGKEKEKRKLEES